MSRATVAGSASEGVFGGARGRVLSPWSRAWLPRGGPQALTVLCTWRAGAPSGALGKAQRLGSAVTLGTGWGRTPPLHFYMPACLLAYSLTPALVFACSRPRLAVLSRCTRILAHSHTPNACLCACTLTLFCTLTLMVTHSHVHNGFTGCPDVGCPQGSCRSAPRAVTRPC